MNVTVIVPPPFEPVDLQSVYRQLRIDPTEDNGESPAVLSHPLDADFERNIKTAREWVEKETHRSLVEQTLRLSTGGFVSLRSWGRPSWEHSCIRLLRPPLISVSSVRYYDGDNALQTVNPSDYYVTDDELPELRFVTGYGAPTWYDRPDALRIEYRAGYKAESGSPMLQEEYAANVPTPLKEAILVGVQMMQTSTSPKDYEQLERLRKALIGPYIVPVMA